MIFLVSWALSTAMGADLVVDAQDPGAWSTVAAALDAAASGDRVLISGDTYNECLDTAGKSLEIQGEGMDLTTLVAPETCGNTLSITQGEQVTVSDLSLSNPQGRAVLVTDSALDLARVGLVNSGATDLYGGGLYLAGSAVTLEDCVLRNNLAEYGGGIYASWYSSLSMEGLTVFENTATVSGGGIFLYVVDSELSLADSVFESNTAESGNGGAIASEWYNHLSVEDTIFRDNYANSSGGALYSAYQQDLLVEDSAFERNTAGWGEGGAIYHYPADEYGYPLQISDSQFLENSAYGSGGAVVAYWLSDLEISGSTFQGNAAGSPPNPDIGNLRCDRAQ